MSLSFRSFGIFHRYRTDLVSTKFNRAGPALIPVNRLALVSSAFSLETRQRALADGRHCADDVRHEATKRRTLHYP